jgi:glycosyltransferase involved in cell wall biosynthesis
LPRDLADRAIANLGRNFDHLRQPARFGRKTLGETTRGSGNGLGSGHAALCRPGRNLRRAFADGSGVQNKLLEALAMGLPCVASTTAWRGAVLKEGDGILATDKPLEFAERIIRLLRDGDWRAEMARRARGAAEAHYRWDVQMAHLDHILATNVSQPLAPAASASLERAR